MISCKASLPQIKYTHTESITDLNGIYVDLEDKARYSSDEHDKIDVLKYIFAPDGRSVEIYGETYTGYELLKEYKGKYNKKKNTIDIVLNHTVIPLIIYMIVE